MCLIITLATLYKIQRGVHIHYCNWDKLFNERSPNDVYAAYTFTRLLISPIKLTLRH